MLQTDLLNGVFDTSQTNYQENNTQTEKNKIILPSNGIKVDSDTVEPSVFKVTTRMSILS